MQNRLRAVQPMPPLIRRMMPGSGGFVGGTRSASGICSSDARDAKGISSRIGPCASSKFGDPFAFCCVVEEKCATSQSGLGKRPACQEQNATKYACLDSPRIAKPWLDTRKTKRFIVDRLDLAVCIVILIKSTLPRCDHFDSLATFRCRPSTKAKLWNSPAGKSPAESLVGSSSLRPKT